MRDGGFVSFGWPRRRFAGRGEVWAEQQLGPYHHRQEARCCRAAVTFIPPTRESASSHQRLRGY